jgi:hypothetical protein
VNSDVPDHDASFRYKKCPSHWHAVKSEFQMMSLSLSTDSASESAGPGRVQVTSQVTFMIMTRDSDRLGCSHLVSRLPVAPAVKGIEFMIHRALFSLHWPGPDTRAPLPSSGIDSDSSALIQFPTCKYWHSVD